MYKKFFKALEFISIGLDFYIDYTKTQNIKYALYSLSTSLITSYVISEVSSIIFSSLIASFGGPVGIIIGAAIMLLSSYLLSDDLENLSDWFYNLIT